MCTITTNAIGAEMTTILDAEVDEFITFLASIDTDERACLCVGSKERGRTTNAHPSPSDTRAPRQHPQRFGGCAHFPVLPPLPPSAIRPNSRPAPQPSAAALLRNVDPTCVLWVSVGHGWGEEGGGSWRVGS